MPRNDNTSRASGLSPSQAAAVEAPLQDTCVMAGAGSGKTRVLTSRYVHLIRDSGLSPHEIAALTFTEKAAGEMRTRVATTLQSALREASGDDAARLRDARAGVEFAPISTIHGYCARLIRREAIVAGVDPQFDVLDSAAAGVLLKEAVERALAEAKAVSPAALSALAGLRAGPRGAVSAVIAALRNEGLVPADLHWSQPDRSLTSCLGELAQTIDDIDENHQGFTRAQRPKWPRCRDQLRSLSKAVAAKSVSPTEVSRSAPAKWVTHVGTGGKFWKPHKQKLLDRLAELEGALWSAWGNERVFAPLHQVVASAYEHFAALKRERTALDFTDLETYALRILNTLQERGVPLSGAPKAILVDEFQDTSRLQAKLLRHLRETAPLFSVGDPKQSIYGFRKADVRVLLDEWERVGDDARHLLADSYRTSPRLLAALNGLGRALITPNSAGVAFHPLHAAGTFLDAPDAPPPACEVHFVVGGEEGEIDRRRRAEADWIAQRIHSLVAGEDSLTKVRSDDAQRPIRLGDIAILGRARASLMAIEDALSRHAIPFLSQSSKGYYLADEIGDLLFALRVVHNPADRFALAALATSPALKADDASIHRWIGEGAETSWHRVLNDSSHTSSIATRWRALARVQETAHTLPLADCVQAVIDALDLDTVSRSLLGGARRSANLQKAVTLASDMDAQGHHDVPSFLQRVAMLRSEGAEEHDAPVGGDGQNVVRLSTIHASKGLEYPVVFLADITRQLQGRPSPVLLSADGGLGVALHDPVEGVLRRPSGYVALLAERKRAELEESMRLFYVATTRAEERLFLSGQYERRTQTGKPAYSGPWGVVLDEQLGFPAPGEDKVVALGDGALRVTVAPLAEVEEEPRGIGPTTYWPPELPDEARRWAEGEARAQLARASEHVSPLRRTRYVVSVSELLQFAKSPADYYRRCVLGIDAEASLHPFSDSWTDRESSSYRESPFNRYARPQSSAADARHAARARDESFEHEVRGREGSPSNEVPPNYVPRDAVGRTLHTALELIEPPFQETVPRALDRALQLEPFAGESLKAVVAPLLYRFLESPLAGELEAALSENDAAPLRELNLHARIRFPTDKGQEKRVAELDSLLVKGSIDLWLPRQDGVWVLDYKTNRRSNRFPTTASLAEYYGWQLRLYALMAERVLGTDIAGAALVLLDPSWSRDPVELPIAIDGDRLRDTRRLCEALARAEKDRRYPQSWQALVN